MTRVKIFDMDGHKKDLVALIGLGVYLGVFPLHDGPVGEKHSNDRSILYASWRGWFKKQPIFLIRNYFGERIAFYFAWIGHYTYWLTIAAAVGTFVFLYGIGLAVHRWRTKYVASEMKKNSMPLTFGPVTKMRAFSLMPFMQTYLTII